MAITGSINLTAFKNVLMKKKNREGKEVIGIFIPLDANDLVLKDKAVYFNIVAFEMKEAKEWATHLVKQSLKKEKREKMTKEEQNAMPLFGNLKIETFDKNAPPAPVVNTFGAEDDKIWDADATGAEGDLPF